MAEIEKPSSGLTLIMKPCLALSGGVPLSVTRMVTWLLVPALAAGARH